MLSGGGIEAALNQKLQVHRALVEEDTGAIATALAKGPRDHLGAETERAASPEF